MIGEGSDRSNRSSTRRYVPNPFLPGWALRERPLRHYFIKGLDGIEKKIHVDKNTKAENVQPGDLVRAYVTDQDHTTALTVVKPGH